MHKLHTLRKRLHILQLPYITINSTIDIILYGNKATYIHLEHTHKSFLGGDNKFSQFPQYHASQTIQPNRKHHNTHITTMF